MDSFTLPRSPDGLSTQQWFTMLSTPHPEGPSIVVPFAIRVAGVVVKHDTFLIWTDGGKVVAWIPASQVPIGGPRRGDWLLWCDGRELQVIHDRPTDAHHLQILAPKMSAFSAIATGARAPAARPIPSRGRGQLERVIAGSGARPQTAPAVLAAIARCSTASSTYGAELRRQAPGPVY